MANLKVHHRESDDLMVFSPISQRKMAVLNIGTSSTAMVRPVVMFNN